MDLIDLLRAIAGRWRLILAAILVAGIAAALTAPTAEKVEAPPAYEATAVLINAQTGTAPTGRTSSLDLLALLVTNGDVPARVATALGSTDTPAQLAGRVRVVVDSKVGVMRISATELEPDLAEQMAGTFTHTFLSYLDERHMAAYDRDVAASKQQLDAFQSQIAALDAQLARTPPDEASIVRGEREARSRDYSDQFRRYQALTSAGPQKAELELLQEPEAVPVEAKGIKAPSSRVARVAIAAAVALLLGIGIAFLLERLDPRIRSKAQAEESFGIPVLAEIPTIAGRSKRARALTISMPLSPSAAAFRLLRTGLANVAHPNGNGNGHGNGLSRNGTSGPKTILVTSPNQRAGKTTVAVNLAAVLAETGRRVVVVSADLRRPTVHRYFGVSNTPGLIQVVNGIEEVGPDLLQKANVRGVWVLPSGGVVENPALVLSGKRAQNALTTLARMCDVVVIDTPSLLDASDAAQLLPRVDAVVVVARTGVTTEEAARRTGEFLRLVHEPVVGVALVGTRSTSGYYGRMPQPMHRRRARSAARAASWE